jgi:ketosteroid isomerase-like protein
MKSASLRSPGKTLLALFCLSLAVGCTTSQPHENSIHGVEQALAQFLLAFNNLDWPAFRQCFASDATLFNPDIPGATSVHRLDGREAIESSFQAVFELTGPPYMHIVPNNLRIQLLGTVAVATFEFGRAGGSFGRRTLVFERRQGRWLIVHLHASNIKAP